MSQSIGPNYNVGSNYPAQDYYNGPPSFNNPNANLDPMMGNAYNNAPPMFGPMQGGGGGNSFGSGSASQDHLADLLNISPLQNQVKQMGVAPTDPSSPSDYYNTVLSPIMNGASKTYHDAMAPKNQKHQK